MKKLIADWKERGPFLSRECSVWWEVLKVVLETRRLAKQRKMKTHRDGALSSHSTHAGGSSGKRQKCDCNPHFAGVHHFQAFPTERQEETWGMMRQQIYPSHRPQPPRTKSFYLRKPSREESFRSRCSLNLPQASLWSSAGTLGLEGKVTFSSSSGQSPLHS